MKWIRVTRKEPCPICKKPDWCCIGTQFVNCMRVESTKVCANGGWLHDLDVPSKPISVQPSSPAVPKINATQIMREWREQTRDSWINKLAGLLGVSALALDALGAALAPPHRAWAWPMRNGHGEPV